jgi:hypothetical protein
MKFLLCWLAMVVLWALIAASIGLQVLAGFVMGAVTVVATSLAVGFAAASIYDREDEWDP